jgi:outer membrane protein
LREPNRVGYTFKFAIRSQFPLGAESILSQADLARVRPGLSVADHNKEKKVNSRFVVRTAVLAAAFILSTAAAWAQAPAAAGSASAGKVGVISIRQAIVTTAEGKVASAELQSKFASRQNEIENLNKQINDLQQRLQAGQNKLSQEEEGRLRQQGQRLAQRLERMNTEYQEDVNAEQADVIDRIGRKMVDVLNRYSRENGFVIVLDSSAQSTPILYASEQIDVTQDIVRLYDQAYPIKAGSTTPAKPAAAKPAPATSQPPAAKP